MSSDEAYEEGYDAYWDGVDGNNNPYDEDTDERRRWEEGWIEARNHDYDESDG
jgi:ribosome modulation factor